MRLGTLFGFAGRRGFVALLRLARRNVRAFFIRLGRGFVVRDLLLKLLCVFAHALLVGGQLSLVVAAVGTGLHAALQADQAVEVLQVPEHAFAFGIELSIAVLLQQEVEQLLEVGLEAGLTVDGGGVAAIAQGGDDVVELSRHVALDGRLQPAVAAVRRGAAAWNRRVPPGGQRGFRVGRSVRPVALRRRRGLSPAAARLLRRTSLVDTMTIAMAESHANPRRSVVHRVVMLLTSASRTATRSGIRRAVALRLG